MAYLKIVKEGDPLLRKTSRPVEEITPRILQLTDDMIDTMRRANGCGLAAVQVGVLRRIVVIEVEENKPLVLINPRILETEGEQREVEGCLSLPKKWGRTIRPKTVTVCAQNRDGKEIVYRGEDLLARAFCHEIDHLDGKLFIDVLDGELETEE